MLNESDNALQQSGGSLGRIHPLWLTYSDPSMEKAYSTSWRNAVRSTNRVWAFSALIFYSAMSLALYRLDPDYFEAAQWFRIYICFPFLAFEVVLACWPSVNKRLFDANYLMTSLICLGNAVVSHGTAPQSLQFFFLLEIALTFVFCGSYFRATFHRVVVFVAMSLLVATPVILYVHLAGQTDLGRLIVEMTIITGVAGTILLAVYHREILSRRNFRDIQYARIQEAEAQRLASMALADSEARSHFLSMVGSEFQLTVDNVTRRSNLPNSGDARLDGYLADIHQSALRLQKTINQIMNVAAGKTDRQVPRFKRIDLAQQLQEAIKRNRFHFNGRTEPQVEFIAAPESEAFADVDDLCDILDELISNTAKHAPAGSPVSCTLLQVSAATLQIRITNESIGGKLTDSQLKQVFSPFVQLDDRLERVSEGLGLGLPMARKLAELNGGRLYLDSPDAGSVTAVLELPVA